MTTPLERVKTSSLDGPVRWGQLERDAFRNHPDVLRHLDEVEQEVAPPSRGETRKNYLLGFFTIFSFLTPLIALGVLLPPRISEGDTYNYSIALPIAAVLFVFADIFQVSWAVKKHEGTKRQLLGAGLFGVGFGGLCLFLALHGGLTQEVAGVWFLAVPFAVAVVAGAVMVARSFRTRRDPNWKHSAEANRGTLQSSPKFVVKKTVEKLTPAEQQTIQQELYDAISELQQQGRIDEKTAAWARVADLGGLALHMNRPHGTR